MIITVKLYGKLNETKKNGTGLGWSSTVPTLRQRWKVFNYCKNVPSKPLIEIWKVKSKWIRNCMRRSYTELQFRLKSPECVWNQQAWMETSFCCCWNPAQQKNSNPKPIDIFIGRNNFSAGPEANKIKHSEHIWFLLLLIYVQFIYPALTVHSEFLRLYYVRFYLWSNLFTL